MTMTVTIASTPQTCTECAAEISDGDAGIYVEGIGEGSRRFELVLCESCAEELRDQIDMTLDSARDAQL